MKSLKTIGEVASIAKCQVVLIRYYESIGLIKPDARSEGGHRLYKDETINKLCFIRRARELGFEINEIRALLELNQKNADQCKNIHENIKNHIKQIQSKISDLAIIQNELQHLVEACSDENMERCSIIDSLFKPKAKKS